MYVQRRPECTSVTLNCEEGNPHEDHGCWARGPLRRGFEQRRCPGLISSRRQADDRPRPRGLRRRILLGARHSDPAARWLHRDRRAEPARLARRGRGDHQTRGRCAAGAGGPGWAFLWRGRDHRGRRRQSQRESPGVHRRVCARSWRAHRCLRREVPDEARRGAPARCRRLPVYRPGAVPRAVRGRRTRDRDRGRRGHPEADHRQRLRRIRVAGGVEDHPVVVSRRRERPRHQSRAGAVLRQTHGGDDGGGRLESRAVPLAPHRGRAADRAGGAGQVMGRIDHDRRRFLGTAVMTLAATGLDVLDSQKPQSATSRSFGPLKHVDAGLLSVEYAEDGPRNGPPVLLLHGWPYDIHSFADVTPLLAAAGYRVIVPHLRGYGTTRFLSNDTFRNGQPAALALDTIALMDALEIRKAILAGFDWGARTANIIAALWPERCKAMVSVSGYLIGNQEAGRLPLPPEAEFQWWYT